MAEESEIIARITEIMGAELGLSAAQLADTTSISDTNISSLEFAEMIFRIEEEFGVSVDVLDIPVVETVGELKQYVVSLVASPPAPAESAD